MTSRFSIVGARRWPAIVWTAVTIVAPVVVFVARGAR